MWFKKKPLPPIELNINLPPDGTYPPRLLVRGASNWLDASKPLPITEHVTIRHNGKQFLLVVDEKADVVVNGQKIVFDYALKDGDYLEIEMGKSQGVFIFQANPVADYRADSKDALPITITPSAQLRKWFVVNETGLSFDGGKHTTAWMDIISIEWSEAGWFKWLVKIVTVKDGKIKKAPTKLTWMSKHELDDLMKWIFATAPFGPSMIIQNQFLTETDAYFIAARNKVIVPAHKNQRELPASREKIFGLIPQSESKSGYVLGFVIIVFFSLITSRPTNFDIESLSRFVLAFVVISIILVVVLLVASLVGNIIATVSAHIIVAVISRRKNRGKDSDPSF